jgi:hypothetical protein
MMEEHTGNDLTHMLEAKKPLAMFYFCQAMDDRDVLPVDDFAPYVKNGRILMEEFDPPLPLGTDPTYQITYVLYALAAEAWRIPAMKIALTAQSENFRKPDLGIDRIIGMLLGYPKQAIDSWIQSGIDKGAYQ